MYRCSIVSLPSCRIDIISDRYRIVLCPKLTIAIRHFLQKQNHRYVVRTYNTIPGMAFFQSQESLLYYTARTEKISELKNIGSTQQYRIDKVSYRYNIISKILSLVSIKYHTENRIVSIYIYQ